MKIPCVTRFSLADGFNEIGMNLVVVGNVLDIEYRWKSIPSILNITTTS